MFANKRSMERATGLEPATSSLGSWHSTTELHPLSPQNMRQPVRIVNQATPKLRGKAKQA
jgi:hypothetical protein